ncbi:MAG: endo-1,4-beta-xylanase [Defluviitaleaceae bacterium]|nr:endo-1,4-beta-xylanase [Defluviitaleaceae bacterium]
MFDFKFNWDLTLPSLYKAFEGKFLMGNIMSPYDLKNPEMLAMYKHHYNAMTSENAMKPLYIAPNPGEWHFDEADALVDFATQNNIAMIGHTLAWHGQSPKWLNQNPDGSPVTRAEAKRNMETFVKTYAGRYSGRIHSWDVINEVFRDEGGDFKGTWRELLRRETDNPRAVGHWYLAYANGADASLGECGGDFIFDVFYFARKYDPHATLYCNEYNEEYDAKRNAMAEMVEDINEEWKKHPDYDNRLLIEGIGMQAHCNHGTNYDNVRKSIERFVKTGAKISVTELDITFGAHNEPANPLTPEQSKTQTEMYLRLFNMYLEFADHIERVTIWGKNDKMSWRGWGAPTLFGNEGEAKEAYHALVNLNK